MKCAICTHCGAMITYDESRREWLHDEPNGLTRNRLTCARIEFATPKRGTVKGDAK